MKPSILLSAILMVMLNVVVNGQSKEEKEVAAAVESLRLALLSGDKAALEKITAEQLSYGHSSGKIETKAQFVEALASGKSDFVSITLNEQTISVSGDLALVRHKLEGENNDNGKPGQVHIGVFTVWQKQKGKWLLIGRQAFKL